MTIYDSIGNRTSSSSTSSNLVSVTHSYTANGLNQYDYVDSTALTYDADGNLTGDGRYSYAYDCENRLVSVTPVSPSSGDLAIVNEYDHMNRRVRKTVRRYDGVVWSDQERHSFVWDGWNIVLERIDVGGSTAHVIEYYWGEDFSGTEQGAGGVGGLLAVSYDGEFYVPIYGGNGNIMGYVDDSGAFAVKFEYDPFGNVVSIEDVLSAPMPSPDGSPGLIPIGRSGEDFYFGFSTKYHDREVGLVAYQLRSYSPALGRWLNRDPIEEEGGLNLYAILDNLSGNYVDVLGLTSKKYIENWAFAPYAGISISLYFNIFLPGVSYSFDPILNLDIKPPVRIKGTGKWHFMTTGVPDLIDSSKRDGVNNYVSYTMSTEEKKCCGSVTVFRYVRMRHKFRGVPLLKFIPLLEGGTTGAYVLDGTLDNYRAIDGVTRGVAPDDTPEGPSLMWFYRRSYDWDFYFEAKCMSGPHKGRILSSCQKFYHADGHWPWEEWGGFFYDK